MAEEKTIEGKVNGAEAMEIIIALRKPVIAHGDEVKELHFREPTGADIEKCGNPVIVDWSFEPPKVSYDAKAMTQMMSNLANVPPSTIRQLDSRDWNKAAVELSGFFVPV